MWPQQRGTSMMRLLMKSLTMPRTLSAIYWRKIWSKAVGLDTLSLFAFSWTCHSCFPRCEPPHRCRHLWQYFIRSSACPPVCVCSSRLVYSRGSMEGLLLILCTFCFCFPPGKMQPEALCAPSSFTVAWPLCKNCSFCMKCSVLIWMFAASQGLARVLLFECGASGYHSFPTNLGIGQERKKYQSWKPCVQETKKKGTNQGEETFFQWVCNRMVENRGLLVCASRTKWRMGVAWSENWTFLFLFFLCLVLQGRRVLSGGKGEVSVIEEKEIWDTAGMR